MCRKNRLLVTKRGVYETRVKMSSAGNLCKPTQASQVDLQHCPCLRCPVPRMSAICWLLGFWQDQIRRGVGILILTLSWDFWGAGENLPRHVCCGSLESVNQQSAICGSWFGSWFGSSPPCVWDSGKRHSQLCG
jgi:hypothetical protein